MGSFLFFQQLGKRIELDAYVTPLRLLYLSVQVSIIALSYLLIYKIKQKNGKVFIHKEKRKRGEKKYIYLHVYLDQTVLKYVEPASQSWDGTESADQLINTTVMGKVLFIKRKRGKEGKRG